MEAVLGRILDDEVEGAINLRDLGGYQTPTGRVRAGRIFRSAMTHHLTERGLSVLAQDFGVRVVVDLRNEQEIVADGVAPFEAHGIRYRNLAVSANTALTPDDQRERMRAFREGTVSWRDLYVQMLTNGKDAFRGVFEAASEDETTPLLFHCTGGRDRTGMAAALLLSALGVSDDDIAHDYALTGEALVPHVDRFERNLREMEMTIDQWQRLTATGPEPIHEILTFVREEHGSVAGYLESVGVPLDVQERVRRQLTA